MGSPKNFVLLFMALALGLTGFAQAQTPYNTAGPYLFDLVETDIDDMLDHFYLLEHPAGDPNDDISTAEREFAKWQLSAPFECYKFDGLCEMVSKPGAEIFLNHFIEAARDLPNAADYGAHLSNLKFHAEAMAEIAPRYDISAAQTLAYHNAIKYFFPAISAADLLLHFPPSSVTSDESNGRSVTVKAGRARWIWAGASFVRAHAHNDNGPNRTAMTLNGNFTTTDEDGVLTENISPSKSKTARSLEVLGSFRHWSINMVQPPQSLTASGTGTAFGRSASDAWSGFSN